jgi:hypothetical protein
MSNWRDVIPSKYFRASDVDTPKLLTITKYVKETQDDEEFGVVYFREDKKGLRVNTTNGISIEDIAGTGDPDRWSGTVVVLYAVDTELRGKPTRGVRVRKPKPGAAPPPPPPEFQADDSDVPF